MGNTLFCVFVFVAGALAGPLEDVKISSTCERQCTASYQFNYETGKTYKFSYETGLRTTVQGAFEDHAGIQLKSNAYLNVISKCEMILEFDEVHLMEHDPETSSLKPVESDLVTDLQRNPLTISFQDGKVEDLCLSTPESEHTLNIKRGFLSIIQNTMDDINTDQTVTETDVSGECETKYTSEDKGWYKKLIKKSKNLLGCKKRHHRNIADTMPYDIESSVYAFIKSTHVCEQEIAKATGRIQRANCQESHSFNPFSKRESGAVTYNTQTLTFIKETKSTLTSAEVFQRAPLQFQHESGRSERTLPKDLERKLTAICDNTQNGVTAETPKLFTSLVKVMKAIGSKDLSLIYQKIQKSEICSSNSNRVRKYFLDAIPMCGTTNVLRYMVQLLTTGEITGKEADIWITTLPLIQNPSTDMLTEVMPLLSIETNLQKSMLSVSSLIHRVCKNNPGCSNLVEVKKLISLMEDKIIPSCIITDDTLKMSAVAIRAIGNAGFGEGAITTLTKCIQITENPTEIRLSAIRAFRRMSCSTDKSEVFEIFSDIQEDSEIRIAAYKTLMECPSVDIIRIVKTVLAGEVDKQVGSYVWSHLTNLMETSDPHKQSIRTILEDETLKKEFDLDQRKFSRNYEKSVFLEKLNTGFTVEADLIWSSQSFIPRSGMLNLTVDLFGNAVNLFEVGGRMEGLEYFLESYFGPNGYFSKNDVNDAVEVTALDVVNSEIINRIDKMNTKQLDDLRGSLYVKIFGNELRYVDFQGLDSLFAMKSVNFLDILMKLGKESDYQYTHSSMFMDSIMVVPTCSGFPLKLTANGTSTIDLKASGLVDVMKLASSPPTMDVHGNIKPSGAIVVSSSMGIDAADSEVGIKMISTLHTSTSVQGKLSLSQGSALSVKFDLPEEKQDIISVDSSFYTVHRRKEREQKMITENRYEHIACTGNNVAKLTGLELCGEIGFPNASLVENAPYFPMTGPIKASLTLYKRDKGMKGYNLEARSIHDKDVNIVRLAFSTPNSNVDRSFGIDFTLDKAVGSIDASFTSPWKRADFTADKTISGKLNYNGEIQFDVSGGLISESSGPRTRHSPTIKVIVPGMIDAQLTGSVNYAPWKYFETVFQVSGLTSTPIAFRSSIENKGNIQLVNARIDISPKHEYSFYYSEETTQYAHMIKCESELSVRSRAKELLSFRGMFRNMYGKSVKLHVIMDHIVETPIKVMMEYLRRRRTQHSVRADVRSSLVELKMRNTFVNTNFRRLLVHIDVEYVIRQIAQDTIKVTTVINRGSRTRTEAKANFIGISKGYPQTNFKIFSQIIHDHRLSLIEAGIAYGASFKNVDKKIGVLVSARRLIKSWSEASATIDIELSFGTILRVLSKIEHFHNPRSLDSNMWFRWNKDIMTASLSLENNTYDKKNIVGGFNLDYLGYSILLTHLLDENKPHEYKRTTNAKFGRSTVLVETSASASELSLSSSFNIDQLSPVIIDVHYKMDPNVYNVSGSVQSGTNIYNLNITLDKRDSQFSWLKLNDPFKLFHSMDIYLHYHIIDASYKTSVTVNRNQNEALYGTLTVHAPLTLKHVHIDFFAKAPILGCEELRASINHYISANNPRSSWNIDMNGQSIKIGFFFNNNGDSMKTDIHGQFCIITTFSKKNSACAIIAYDNDDRKLDSSALLEYNEKTMGIQTSMRNIIKGFKLTSKGELSLTTPSDTMQTTWTHEHTTSQISTMTETTWDNNRVYVNFNAIQDVSLPKGNFSVALEIQTSLAALKKVVLHLDRTHMSGQIVSTMKVSCRNSIVQFVHQTSTSGFNTQLKFEKELYKYMGDIKFLNEPTISFDATIRTPFKYVALGRIFLKCEGFLNNFILNAIMQINKDKSESTFVCNMQNKYMNLTIKVSTPFVDFRDISASLVHRGTAKNFNTIANFDKNGKSLESIVEFKSSPGIAGSASLKSIGKFYGCSFNIERNFKMFSSVAELNINNIKTSAYFDMDNRFGFEAKFGTKSQIFKDIDIYYMHSVMDNSINTHTYIAQNGIKRYSLQSTISNKPGIGVIISITTPYAPYESTDFSFHHEITLSNFRSEAVIQLFGEIYEGDFTFTTDQETQALFLIRSPFSGDIGVSVTFQGSMLNLNSSLAYLSGKKSKMHAEISLNLEGPYSGDLKLITPMFKTITASFNHQGGIQNFVSEAHFTYAGKKSDFALSFKSIASELDKLQHGKKYSLKGDMKDMHSRISVTTPFAGFEDISAEFRYQWLINDIQASTKLVYMTGKEIFSSFQNTFSEKKIEAKAQLETPYTNDFSFELLLTGELGDFSNVVTISMGEENTMTFTTGLTMEGNRFVSDSFLQTVIAEHSDEQKITISFNGVIPNIDATISAEVLGCKYYVSTYLKIDDCASGKIIVKLPLSYLHDVAFGFEHSGSTRRFITKSSLQYNPDKKIEISLQYMRYDWRKLQTILEIQTPFDGFYSQKGKRFVHSELSIDIGNKNSVQITVRKPFEVMVKIEGSTNSKYEVAMAVYKDTASLNNAFKFNGVFDPTTRQLSLQHSCPQMTGSFNGTFQLWNNNFDLYLNSVHYGYKMDLANDDRHVKVILPNRSLLVKGRKSASITECSFMWDADNDETRKEVFRSGMRHSKAYITIMMPSIRKVSINGQFMALPVVLKNTFVISQDGRTSVNVAGHITVEFDSNEDLFVVKLNGFYFGKTNGLFGSYDNEPFVGMLTTYGEL